MLIERQQREEEMHIVIIKRIGSDDEYSWDLLSDENLKRMGINRANMGSIEPFFDVPGHLYSEPGVAGETHPTGGSVGYWIYPKLLGSPRVSVQDIFYYDFGHEGGLLKGIPHWNHER